jgi:hypothetical protein
MADSRYCTEPRCIARPTQRVTTRCITRKAVQAFEDDYCTRHAAEVVAELGDGPVLVSVVALPALVVVGQRQTRPSTRAHNGEDRFEWNQIKNMPEDTE